ncbi:hypothetical protein Tco_0977500, partial [Tanacetum coccineum]
DNDEMEHAMDVDNEDGKYCLDDMSIGFEEDKSNGEIKNINSGEPSKLFKLAWDPYGIVVDDQLWLAFLGLEEKKRVHIELWVELLWRFRAPNADWTLACPHFCPAIIGGGMPIYISKAKGRYVPWTNVDKVYFPLNEPELHWALAELHLYTGLGPSMYPGRIKPIGFGVSWDPVDGEAMLGEHYEMRMFAQRLIQQQQLQQDFNEVVHQ